MQLVIGYQGMIRLFWQHPLAAGLDAQVVYEGDEFDCAYGLDPVLRHVPPMSADHGQPVAYYAVARLKDGGSAFVVLSPGDRPGSGDGHRHPRFGKLIRTKPPSRNALPARPTRRGRTRDPPRRAGSFAGGS